MAAQKQKAGRGGGVCVWGGRGSDGRMWRMERVVEE